MGRKKKCFVPTCNNTAQNSPEKLLVPIIDSLKELWCRKLKVKFNTSTRYYCCEDHLNPEEDLENYSYCKLMNGRPKMKPTAVLRLNTSCKSSVSTDLATDSTPDSSKHGTSELFKLLSCEDAKPKRALKLDSPTWPFRVSVGVQCKAKTRDACVSFIGRKNLPIGFKQPTSSVSTYTEIEVMDLKNPCRFCLLRPPNSDLKTPYTHDDKTEIYSDVFEECFGIQLALENDDECGICEMCVNRLRDARDFKLQVQRSQAGLRAHLGGALTVKDEILADDSEMSDNWLDENEPMPSEPGVKLEVSDEMDNSENAFITFNEVEVEICKEEPNFTEENPSIFSARLERSDDATRLQCHMCRKTFKREASLKNHIRTHCQYETQEKNDSYEDESCDNKVYTCDQCGKEFTRKLSYSKHIQAHEMNKQYSCDMCSKVFSREGYLTLHKKSHTRELYICDMCKQKFNRKRKLAAHIATHMKCKPFSCEVCNKKFKNKYGLNGHRLLHIEDKPYSCKICKKNFAHAKLLDRHKLTHKKGSFVCETCGKQFICMSMYKVHRRTHTGEKPYECSICKKQFSSKGNMILHERTHTGVKPYSCELCPKKFSCSAGLKHHKIVHTGEKPFSCEICHKQFSGYSSLKLHKMTHTGEKPHCCHVCGRKFGRKAHLSRHLDTHMERRSYACEFCPKVYTHKEGFAQHLRSHAK